MIVSKRLRYTIFFSLLLTFATGKSAFSQIFAIDTTSFFYTEDTLVMGPHDFDYDQTFEDEAPETNFIPADMIFVPSDVVYNNRWDTLYIRTGKVDLSEMKDSVVLVLNNPQQGQFCFPFKGKLLSPYGMRGRRFHAGMDIKLELGDTVKSAFDGKVRIARVMSGYGKLLVIRHTNGLETVYGHLSKILVKNNQEVRAGEPIGLGGRTGRATTTHLHFETRFLGEHFNPARIIDFDNYTLKQDKLIVDKYFFSKKKTADKSVNSQGAVTEDNSSTKKYHTIKTGDTLYALALRYKTTVSKITRLNGISERKTLKVGSRLRVK
ncbi:MAG: peptidoglycan DD-metalloendopeptidase family protein [Lentimicrobiaceae bacterium]|nr:peptidoglycan DD-metalloendopeptidase family protein [Lentimicrobiaceae bacterium]MCB9023734.1 peptidoglycan DD-metalloendopeptidase family protein [Lentimicrobiaceae bacterium]MCO5266233.1 peptidoglycan DD-metalloendopeptidase family protein [Lentimicrobium sp.]